MWKGSENEISKLVLFVDQTTKLITSIEFYEQRQSQDYCACILEYSDYNQPIATEKFVLEDEIPAEIMDMAEQRKQAKLSKDWAAADQFRDAITAAGFTIEDMPGHEYRIKMSE